MVSCRRRPLPLPGLRVAEEIDFGESIRVGALNREGAQDLERRARGVLGVVAGLEEEKPVRESGAERRGDAAAVDRQEQQTQPTVLDRSVGQSRVEAVYRSIGSDRCVFLSFPAGCFETKGILERGR